MQHVLCATDGSEPSRNAVAYAAALAGAMNARLTILAVQPYVVGRFAVHDVMSREEVAALLEDAGKIAAAAGIAAPRLAEERARDIAHAILTFAENNGIDHIVLGSTGKGGVKQFLLGSVSAEVLRKSFCPVTVVH